LSTGAAAPVGAGAGVEVAGADDAGLAGAGADLFEFDAAGFDEGDFDEDDFDLAGFEEPDGPLAGTLTTAWHWGHLIRLPAALSGTRRRRLQLEQTTSIGMAGYRRAIPDAWRKLGMGGRIGGSAEPDPVNIVASVSGAFYDISRPAARRRKMSRGGSEIRRRPARCAPHDPQA
jgi:hypothetical protein